MLVRIYAVARTASGRVGVHVDQTRKQQGLRVFESPDGGAGDLWAGSDDAIAADGDGSRAIESGVGTEHAAGSHEQVEGTLGVGQRVLCF